MSRRCNEIEPHDEEYESFLKQIPDLSWRDLVLCGGQPTNMFFDDYESDETVAAVVDEMCLSCPVLTQCLELGIENKEWGVWGGLFLSNGKVDKQRNSHKTPDVWDSIRERISE